MDKIMYIQSGNSNEKISISRLLLEHAKKIESLGDAQPIYLFLAPGTSSDAGTTIESEVNVLDKNDTIVQEDAIQLLLGNSGKALTSKRDKSSQSSVKMLEIWNPVTSDKIEDVASIPSLLRSVASKIDLLGEVTILDMIMHDYIDDDALYRPYIRIYYQD